MRSTISRTKNQCASSICQNLRARSDRPVGRCSPLVPKRKAPNEGSHHERPHLYKSDHHKENEMSCLEIVSVRTRGRAQTTALLELCRQLRPPPLTPGSPAELKVYCSVGYDTDLSVHIHWKSDTALQGKSALGLEVRATLSDFGLTNHTFWREHEEVATDSPA